MFNPINMIHLNNAGASLMPNSVTEAIGNYMAVEIETGGYETQAIFANQLQQFYSHTAQLLNTQPQNIAFCYSSTDAYARALSAIPFRAGDVILTTNDDYISNQTAFLSLQKRFGIRLERANDLPGGGVDPEHFTQLARHLRPVLLAVTHVPTNAGRIQPVEAFGPLAREIGAWYLVDACQSVGQMPVDAEAIGADFLCATGRKFLRGPRGTGFLYVSDRILEAGLEPLFIDMRGADWTTTNTYTAQLTARRFEQWESFPALQLGLSEAIRLANETGLATIQTRNRHLRERLRSGLAELPGLRLLDEGEKLASLLLFTLPDQESPQAIMATLKEHAINFSMSYTNFALIDWERKGVKWAVRFSPHYYNTDEEIDEVLDVMTKSLNKQTI